MKKGIVIIFLIFAFLFGGCVNDDNSTDSCAENGHSYNEGEISSDGSKIVFTCEVCGITYYKSSCEHNWVFEKTETNAHNNMYRCTICSTINFEPIIYDCVHEWNEGEPKEDRIVYTCNKCDETRTEFLSQDKKYLKDLLGTIEEKEIYFVDRINNQYVSAHFLEDQKLIFDEMFDELKESEIVEATWCNCYIKLRVGFTYTIDNVINHVYISQHNHGIVVHYNNKFYSVKLAETFDEGIFKEILNWFSVNEDNIIYEEYDYMSDGKLEYLHKNYHGYPEGFAFENAVEKYERIVNSTTSFEEATKMLEDRFTNSDYCTYKVELVEETPYYYAIYVEWGPWVPDGYKLDEIVVSFKKDIYDYETNTIKTKDPEIIKKILDYIQYSYIYNIGGHSILYTNMDELNDHYRHVTYFISTTYGDFNVSDHVRYERKITLIDKNSGFIRVSNTQLINDIYIVGQGENIGAVNSDGLIANPIIFDVTNYLDSDEISDLLNKPTMVDLKVFEEKYDYPYIRTLWEENKIGILIAYQEAQNKEYDYPYPVYRDLSITNNVLNVTRLLYQNHLYNAAENDIQEITHVELVLVPNSWKNLNFEEITVKINDQYME